MRTAATRTREVSSSWPSCSSRPASRQSGEGRKGVRMRRGLLRLSIACLALTVVPAASAHKPAREVIPAPGDLTIADQCDFPVLAHIEGGEIDTTFFDKAGDPVKLHGVFPGQTLTVTNLDTGRSVTVVDAGAFQALARRDGS